METLAMYHGGISKSRAEEILAVAGRDGSFLIRDSESVPNTYCICVLCDKFVYTYRVIREEGMWKAQTAPGVKERLFRKVTNLIAAYQLPNQGMAAPLIYPVSSQKHHYQPVEKRPLPRPPDLINY